jgi:leucyl aminopeptidase
MRIVNFDHSTNTRNSIYLIADITHLNRIPLSSQEHDYVVSESTQNDRTQFVFHRFSHFIYVQLCSEPATFQGMETLRRAGDKAAVFFTGEKQQALVVRTMGLDSQSIMAFAEGLALGAYGFWPYKQKLNGPFGLEEIYIDSDVVFESQIDRLHNLVDACCLTRDLVNEPPNVLTASVFAHRMAQYCREAGASAEILDLNGITELGMEALLTVNKGSQSAPTFTILKWKPDAASSSTPVVLVGKGLVFDTGGINLKPTAGLDTMKCDMAGGAAVFGVMYALAKNKVPVHVIGLIPATDNRPGENAMVPGDIIRMGNGKSVEIVNTDAEGRLILADALLLARRYNPRLVIDMATLTGAATAAIGRFGIAGMHKQAAGFMKSLLESGMRVHERIVEFPLWDEYEKDLESDVADLRNLGKGKGGGAITAAKFLSHFTDYPWIHLDIATMAFMEGRESYLGKGGTAVGVRLLYDLLERDHLG